MSSVAREKKERPEAPELEQFSRSIVDAPIKKIFRKFSVDDSIEALLYH
jgi:hypothetical protein